MSHNGNLINSKLIRDELEAYGSIFQSTNDSEVIVHLIALSREKNLIDRIIDAVSRIKGSYSLLILTEKENDCHERSVGYQAFIIGKA